MKKIATLIIVGSVLNATAQPCIPNTNSIAFDGFSSYISISPQNGFALTTAVTVEAWIKPSSFGFNSAQNSIVCKHGWSAGEGGYVLRCGGSGELSFNLAGIDSMGFPVSWVEVISNVNALSLNSWTHVAGTFDGSQIVCYVNGVAAAAIPFQGTIAVSTAYPLTIGALSDPVWGPGRYFDGDIDEVRVWNRALSESELQAGMNNHIDPTTVTGLVSYWRMNEAAGTSIYDVAGTNNGSMLSCTWDTSVPFNAVPPSPTISYSGDTLYSSAASSNQWYLDGTPVSGATDNYYIPLQNGNYSVEVTSPEGCSSQSAPFNVTDVYVNQAVQEKLFVTVYPNPLTDQSVIEIRNLSGTNQFTLKIFDATGRLVYELQKIESSRNFIIPFDGNRLESGTYIFDLEIAEGSDFHGRIFIR